MKYLGDEVHVVLVGNSTFVADWSNGMSGTVYSDIVNLAKYRSVLFVLLKGAGAVGTTKITVESCDNVTPTTPTAIAFNSRSCVSIDTMGSLTARTAAGGLTTTAGADQSYQIEVNADGLYSTDKFVRLKMVEVAATAVDATIIAILSNYRHRQDVPVTALA